MQHSVKQIGKNYAEISDYREDEKRFNANDFFDFALKNESKYHIVKNGDDLLVSTWYSGDLITDYQKTL